MSDAPAHLDLQRDKGLTITWKGGSSSFYPIAYLRRNSPSAEAKQLREELQRNPLAVLPSSASRGCGQPLSVLDAELVGNYAVRFKFSDGHSTGIYSWTYLRQIDPQRAETAVQERER